MEKELDKIKMSGVLPAQGAGPIPVGKIPDGATQVAKSGTASGTTTEIRAVPGLVTLYLTAVTWAVINDSGATQSVDFIVTNAANETQYYFHSSYYLNGQQGSGSVSFPTPLEIPGGYKIKVVSPAANAIISGSIFGYEI